jgi:phospholipid/cholesterol/gamma-HCH transport system substrate-binding protein
MSVICSIQSSSLGNFSEDTEALKRNFSVRGFFRRRGHYSLLRINPEAYRKDPTFTSSKDDRVWLSEDKLFTRNANGHEELTP